MLRKIILIVFILIAVLVVAVVAAALLIDPDDYREELAARASEQLGREVRLEGPMELKFFPWLALDIRDVSIGNPSGFESAPPLARIDRATASVRVWPLLRGGLEVGAIGIEQAGISLVSDRQGRSNLSGLFKATESTEGPSEVMDLSGFSTGAINFYDVVLSLIDLAEGSRTDLRLASLRLDPFSPGQVVGLALSGEVVDDQESTLLAMQFDGDVYVAPDLSEVRLADWILDFGLPGVGASGTARGSLTVRPGDSPISLNFSAFESEMDIGGKRFGLQAGEPIEITLADRVSASLPAASLDLDGQALVLSGEAVLGETIRARLDVRGERLDLARLAPEGGGSAAEDGSAAPADADFSALSALELDFALDLGELILAEGLTLTSVEARSRLAKGLLTLDPLSARLFGGRFEGRAGVDFNQQPPEVVLSPRLSGIRVAELAALLTGRSPVEGQGEFGMDVRFSGLTPEGMLSTLDGAGDFTLADGALKGVDLNALIEQELTTSNLGNIARSFGGETRFKSLGGDFRVNDGVIELPNLNLAAAGFGASGQGRIDLGAGALDYALVLDLGEELAGKLPGALRRATNGRIPISVSGDLARPIVSVNLAALVEGAVRDEVGNRLLEALKPRPDGETAEGEDGQARDETAAGEEDATDDREQRREAGRDLIRGLLGKRERSEEKEEPEEAESEPPPGG